MQAPYQRFHQKRLQYILRMKCDSHKLILKFLEVLNILSEGCRFEKISFLKKPVAEREMIC